jgi:hypothetical protein
MSQLKPSGAKVWTRIKNYQIICDAGDLLILNKRIDEFIEEVKEIGETLKLKEKLKNPN